MAESARLDLVSGVATALPLPVVDLPRGGTVRVWLARDRQGTPVHERLQWTSVVRDGLWSHPPTVLAADHDLLHKYRGARLRVLVEWAGRRVGELAVVVAR